MPWIFSYAYRGRDKDLVKKLYGNLQSRGHDIFYGPDATAGDTGFETQWVGELVRRKLCVCFFSPLYLTPYCLKECAIARDDPSVQRFVVLLCEKKDIVAPLKAKVP